METLKSYIDRKREEIELLRSHLACPGDEQHPQFPAMAMERKFKLAAAIKAEHLVHDWAATETARAAKSAPACGPFRFNYDYQRADLHVNGPAIYPALGAPSMVTHRSLYTASGMSALSALFTALARSRGPLQVWAPEPCYGETSELLDSLGGSIEVFSVPDRWLHERSGAFRIAMLDSSSPGACSTSKASPQHRSISSCSTPPATGALRGGYRGS